MTSRVYVLTNSEGYITRIEGEYSLPFDLSGWTLIDQGESSDRLNLAQSQYLEHPVRTVLGAYQYKLVDGKPQECTPEEIKEQEDANQPELDQSLEDRVTALEEALPQTINDLNDARAAMSVFGFASQAEAQAMRPAVSAAVQTLPDNQALTVKPLYPIWEDLVKLGTVEADAGYKFTYQGDLYKCRNANPQFQATWIPGIDTAALYERIDETHAGTIDDPIPYSGNMTLEKGLYYSQDGVVYECIEGTGIPVYAALKDLPRYVQEVAA